MIQDNTNNGMKGLGVGVNTPLGCMDKYISRTILQIQELWKMHVALDKKIGETEDQHKKKELQKELKSVDTNGKKAKLELEMLRKCKRIEDALLSGGDLTSFSGFDIYVAQKYFWKLGNLELVKKISSCSRKKLEEKGLISCGNLGWYKKEDVALAGLVYKFGDWMIEDRVKFTMFWKRKKEEEERMKLQRQQEEKSLQTNLLTKL